MKTFKLFILCFLLAVVYSCSKEDPVKGPDTSGEEEPELLTGVFVDSEVAGLSFSTETQSGNTNENGEFFYYEGETVTFSVGDIELGSGEGDTQMTPISIASTANASVESQEVKNIAAFLQTLDADSDPSNGISIDPAVVEAISVNEIDFTGNIVAILGEMVAEINLAIGSNLQVVFPEMAAVHMASTLGEDYDSEDYVFSSFLPTFTDLYSTMGGTSVKSIYWIHEVDEEGLLISSSRYDKYPERILTKFNYTQHSELMLPTEFEILIYNNDVPGDQLNHYKITYSNENYLEKINFIHPETGDILSGVLINNIDEENRVVVSYNLDANGDFLQRNKKVFDDSGNIVEVYRYQSEEGEEYVNKTEYLYTDFGDYSQIINHGNGQTSWENHFYREDNSREKFERTYSNNDSKNTFEFNQNEVLTKIILDWGWTTIIRYFHDNGVLSKEEHYNENGELTKVVTYDDEGNLISSETF